MELKFSKIELEYILGLIEYDMDYNLYDKKRKSVLSDLYSKLVILNK